MFCAITRRLPISKWYLLFQEGTQKFYQGSGQLIILEIWLINSGPIYYFRKQ